MQGSRRVSVMVLYAHALMGEGLARILAAEPDLDVRAVAAHEGSEGDVLAHAPDVVIVERGVHPGATDLLDLAPGTLFIEFGMDAGPMLSYRCDEIPARPGGILRAIRHARPTWRVVPATHAGQGM